MRSSRQRRMRSAVAALEAEDKAGQARGLRDGVGTGDLAGRTARAFCVSTP